MGDSAFCAIVAGRDKKPNFERVKIIRAKIAKNKKTEVKFSFFAILSILNSLPKSYKN